MYLICVYEIVLPLVFLIALPLIFWKIKQITFSIILVNVTIVVLLCDRKYMV